MQDAVVAAENQTFWTDKGIDPKGILRALFSNARGNAPPGCVHDHPAVRQDPLPDQRAELQAQDQGSDRLAEDPAAAEQGGGPRGLPQHHLLRPRRLRHPGRRRGLLRQPGQGPQPARVAPSSPPCSTTRRSTTRPTARRPSEDLKDRYAYVLDSMADMETITPEERDKAAQAAAEVPQDRQPRASSAARRATCSRWSRRSSCACGIATEDEIDGGGLRITTTFDPEVMADVEAGRRRAAARAACPAGRQQGAAHRRRHRRSRHRRAARLLRRPGLPRLPDQLGGRRRHGRLDDEGRHRRGRDPATASRSTTPSRATRPIDIADAPSSRTRATSRLRLGRRRC